MKYEHIPVDSACNREFANRANVILMCDVRQGTRPWMKATLEDISQTGFKIAWLPGCSPHMPLRIRIPGMQLLSADVRWQQGKAVGCSFTEPLHIAVFENIVRQTQLR